jgi:sulfide:quinone oxidoreductase
VTPRDSPAVLIAGGGIAAIEAAIALRELAGDAVVIQLLAPEPSFWYRPAAVAKPFGLGEITHVDLGRIADALGAELTLGALAFVDAGARRARTAGGAELAYDALLIACGAVPTAAVEGALTFRGPADAERMSGLLDELGHGDVHRVAFALPRGAVWPLPAYELALMTAAWLAAHETAGVELALATPEAWPLELFGRAAGDAVRSLLDEAGIAFHGRAAPDAVEAGWLRLDPDRSIPADRVVAVPRLVGPRLDGVPQTVDGFLLVDDHGRVAGLEGVFAAGDITQFPVKQGGIAAQQARAAAEAIAADAGIAVEPQPFRPVLRGLLLTGTRPYYLRHNIARGGVADWAAEAPLWWPPAKVVGGRLLPFLAELTGDELGAEPQPPPGGLAVEVELSSAPADDGWPDEEAFELSPGRTVREVMTPDPLVVAPTLTLDAVAQAMRERHEGSALVVEAGRLVGIVTSRDLVRAVAFDAPARVSTVRHWMTALPVAVAPSTPVAVAVALMAEHGIHRLPVVDRSGPIGTITLRAAVRASPPAVGLGF